MAENEMQVTEKRKAFAKYEEERHKEVYKKIQDQILRLTDLTKSEGSRTYTLFSKTLYRQYAKNPYNNQENLRNLSQFLYTAVAAYQKIIRYYANFIDLSAYSVIPLYDITSEPNQVQILKQYYNTLLEMEKMNLKDELYKMILTAWIEDAAYGLVWEDDQDFMITLFDGNYAKVQSVFYDSVMQFAIDFSYFRSHQDQLEMYGEPFVSMYEAYRKDPSLRWQEVPAERGIVLKINTDLKACIPPFMGLFPELIDLEDLREIQSVKDELSVYKLLVERLDTISGSDVPDDFTVSPDTAVLWHSRLLDLLNEHVGAVISPMQIDVVDFPSDETSDVNKISNAMDNLFDSSGGAQVLNSNSISGSTAYQYAIRSDSLFALNPLLGQIERWTNHHCRQVLGSDAAKVVFMKISAFEKDQYRDQLLKSAQYGIPNKIAISTLDGFSPLEVLSMQNLENNILQLHDQWIPLQSSFTRSGDSDPLDTDPLTGGRPTSDEPLSDEGDNTRDKK